MSLMGDKGSPITRRQYGRGRAPANKGKKLTPEALTPDELDRLLASFSRRSKVGSRNRAMVALMGRAGFKIGQVVAMERRHYRLGGRFVTVPRMKRTPERAVEIDAATREVLDDWLVIRSKLDPKFDARALAPMFPAVSKGSIGNPLNTAYVREMLREQAHRLRIEKRVTAEGLRRTYEAQQADRSTGINNRIGAYVDEEEFRRDYPGAYEKWRDALEFFVVNPERHATRIGHGCREALMTFADEVVTTMGINSADAKPNETIKKIRAVLASSENMSDKTRELVLAYFGTASDLTQRQEHGALRENEPLTANDGRRVVFHTMLAMYEVHEALREG
jgi:integrase-like protein